MNLVPRSFRVLRHRQLQLVVLGNLVSQLGTWSQYVGVGWAATRLSDSKFALGVAFAAPWTASLFLSPIAGVLADRYDRRTLVVGGNVAMALPPFALGLMLQRGDATVTWLIVLVFLGGVAQALSQPASMALVPHLVPEAEVQQAIALNSGIINLTRIVGPGIGGFAIARWGVGWAFHLNAASFFAVVLAWWFVRVPPLPPVLEEEGFVERLQAGVRYSLTNPAVGWLLLLAAVTGFFVMHAPLMPVFAKEVLDGDAGTYALLSSAPGVGAFLGAVAAGELTSGRARRRAMGGGAIGMGLCLLVFSQSTIVALSVVCLALFGLAFFLVNSLITSTAVMASTDEYRGRVMGLLGTANVGLIPINAVVAGALASAIGPVATVAGASTGLFLFTSWFVMSGRLRGVGNATGHVEVEVAEATDPDTVAAPPVP